MLITTYNIQYTRGLQRIVDTFKDSDVIALQNHQPLRIELDL